MKKNTDLNFNKELYSEVKTWVIWPTIQYPETVIQAIVGLACREYKNGWKDARIGLYNLQHKNNRRTKRMEWSRHRYHRRIRKKFNNCSLCILRKL